MSQCERVSEREKRGERERESRERQTERNALLF